MKVPHLQMLLKKRNSEIFDYKGIYFDNLMTDRKSYGIGEKYIYIIQKTVKQTKILT